MLKTITKVKEMKIDELIKYVRENKKTLFKNRVGITFSTKNNNEVTFYQHGELSLDNWISSVDLFEVEAEEEITEDTKFELLVGLFYDKGLYKTVTRLNSSINRVRDSNTVSIHALISGKLELIWERDDHGSN